MQLHRVAIVGRPNVGKSSILNMLAGKKVSIVDPVPGVTRDRVSHMVELPAPEPPAPMKMVEVTDTGGYGVYVTEGGRIDDAGEDLTRLTAQIEKQISEAVAGADLILFVVDVQSGVTAHDLTIAKLLRERALGRLGSGLRVQVVANKCDADRWEAHALDAARLGFGEAWVVSAKTNFRRRDFCDRLWELLNGITPGETLPQAEMKIAIVGRRNAGKSSFVNALAGEERCIVSEIAGTTRDAIDVRFDLDGRTCVAIDTAGVRRRTRYADRVEHWAHDRALRAIERSDVVLLLLDATREIAQLDKKLGRHVLDQFKPCVIVVTKWDLVEGRKNRKGEIVSREDYQQYIEDELPGLSMCPIVFASSVDNYGVRDAIDVAFDLRAQAQKRVTTGKLNELFRGILSKRGPSSTLGTRVKVLYVTQVATEPPTIVLVVNHPELFKPAYMRYLLNRVREETPFEEVPVRLIVRERRRETLEALRARPRRVKDDAAALVDEDGFAIEDVELVDLAAAQAQADDDTPRTLDDEGHDEGDDEAADLEDNDDVRVVTRRSAPSGASASGARKTAPRPAQSRTAPTASSGAAKKPRRAAGEPSGAARGASRGRSDSASTGGRRKAARVTRSPKPKSRGNKKRPR